MRRDITFTSEGVDCAAWLYVPESPRPKDGYPAIVMAHGFGGVKEAYLDDYAAAFCARGFVVTAFDYRGSGASEGMPRNRIDPFAQHADYRNAISWTQALPDVDPGAIGAWGSSYAGGHVIHLARIDRRIKAAVAQVPFINGPAVIKRTMPPEAIAESQQRFSAERTARYRTGAPPAMFPITAQEGQPAMFSTPDAHAFFVAAQLRAPHMSNVVTLDSLEAAMYYEPDAHIEDVSPTPLLLVVAKQDVLTPTDITVAAFDRAHEPKKLVMIDGGHFDAYTGDGFVQSSNPAVEWFKEHLSTKAPVSA